MILYAYHINLSAYHCSHVIIYYRVFEIQVKTVRRHRKKTKAMALIKHSPMLTLGNCSDVLAPPEFAHIDSKLHRICDTCKGTKPCSSQLYCDGCQSLYLYRCSMTQYFLKHIQSEHQ